MSFMAVNRQYLSYSLKSGNLLIRTIFRRARGANCSLKSPCHTQCSAGHELYSRASTTFSTCTSSATAVWGARQNFRKRYLLACSFTRLDGQIPQVSVTCVPFHCVVALQRKIQMYMFISFRRKYFSLHPP